MIRVTLRGDEGARLAREEALVEEYAGPRLTGGRTLPVSRAPRAEAASLRLDCHLEGGGQV